MREFLVEAKVLECRGANSDEETYLKQELKFVVRDMKEIQVGNVRE